MAVITVLFVMAGVGLTTATAAHAATPLTGRLVDAFNSDAPVGGVTLALRRVVDSSTAGATVDTSVTAADGTFALDPVADPTYFVQVIAGRYQGGFVGVDPVGIKPTPADAVTWSAGADLGDVETIPAFARGRVVDSRSRHPVRGVIVTARDILDRSIVLARDVTDANGRFELTGLSVEEIALRFNGASVSHETGYGGCGHGVVPTFGQACTFGTGALGTFRLDHS